MRILGLDSSGLVASVAIVEDDNMLAEYTVNYKKTHSQTLLPMLDEIAKMIDLNLATIDGIALAAGPGSFTGLRIGSATAKGLGLALGKPLISVPTVDGLAYNLCGHHDMVCPLMDARRNQVYTGLYEFAPEPSDDRKKADVNAHFEDGEDIFSMTALLPQCAVGIDEIVEKINEMERPVVFLGDGVAVFREYIAANCKVPYSFAPAHMNKQRAGAIAALGLMYAKAGKVEAAADHRPDYLRLSQAEREQAEKERKAQEMAHAEQ